MNLWFFFSFWFICQFSILDLTWLPIHIKFKVIEFGKNTRPINTMGPVTIPGSRRLCQTQND